MKSGLCEDILEELDEGRKATQEVVVDGTVPRHDVRKINEFDEHFPFPIALVVEKEKRAGVEVEKRLNLEPGFELEEALENGGVNLGGEGAVGIGGVGGDELPENEKGAVGGEALEGLAGGLPGGEGVLNAGDSEAKGNGGGLSVLRQALSDVFLRVSEVPGAGPHLHVHHGGFGVPAEEVLQDQVGVGAGAVRGLHHFGAVEGREEGQGDALVGPERGVKRHLPGPALVVLERLVESSRLIHQRAHHSVLRLVPRHLVLRYLQHFCPTYTIRGFQIYDKNKNLKGKSRPERERRSTLSEDSDMRVVTQSVHIKLCTFTLCLNLHS